ncbi:MAG: lysophospholipid acyltransferase family protein [Gemmatimonadaceae bacterium]
MITSPPVIRTAIRLLRVVPVGALRVFMRSVGTMGYYAVPARRRTVQENVARLAPGASPAAQRAMARRTFANLFDASVDLFRLPTASKEELDRLVGIEGREHLDAALAMGCGVVAVTPHLGPYELGGAWLAMHGYPVHALTEDIDPDTNAALSLYREATGMKLISRTTGLRAVLKVLKQKEIVLLVADRVVGAGSEGVTVPFGEGRRAIPTGPAAFALATGAPIIVGHIARSPGRGTRYLIRLEPPIVPVATGDAAGDREGLARLVGERLALVVQQHPDQWFVFQPEWNRRDASSRA